jgi:hypothetical protein
MPTGFPGEGIGQIIMAIVVLMLVVGIGTMIFRAVQGVREWSHNNDQPVLTVPAKIVTKRHNVSVRRSHHHHGHDHHHHSHGTTSTRYFATFELEGGERMEFELPEREAGLLAEGDRGELTYQGTRYHGFHRRTLV